MAGDIVGQAPEVDVWISPTINREFRRRGIFPELCTDDGVGALFRVTRELAQEIADAATKGRADHDAPRGAKKSYTALLQALRPQVSKPPAIAPQVSPAEQAEWRKKAAEAEAQVKRATDELDDLPASRKEYARRAADAFWSAAQVLFGYCQREPGDAGYCFSGADRERFTALATGLYWEIRRAKPRFDAGRRLSKLTEARANAAKVDLPLQRMLAEAIACPMPAEPEDEGQQAA